MNHRKPPPHRVPMVTGTLAAIGACLLLVACGADPAPEPNPTADSTTNPTTQPPPVTVTQTRTPTVTATATATAPVTQTVTVSAWPSSPTEPTTPSPTQPAPPSSAPADAAITTATVASVHDGDTLTLTDGTKVRVLGVDAPEIPPAGSQCFGEQAAKAAQDLMPKGTQVTLEPDPLQPSPDPYGRTLAYVGTPDGDLGALLISGGYARVYAAYPVSKTPMYQSLQDEAFAGQRGLWATPENGGCPGD